MSDQVELCADGIFTHKWDGEQKQYIRKRVKKMTVCTQLRNNCVIAPGTTLGQIFAAVDKYKLLKLFISQYSWCQAIDEFHAQALEPIRNFSEEKMTHLEIYWHSEVNMFTEKIKHPGGLRERIKSADFELSVDFHGIGPSDDDKTNQYSVSYSPMYDLVDLPVILKKEFVVCEPWKPDKKSEKILESKREFTFLEVLDAIYWDISFMGGPADNREFIEDMKSRLDDSEESETIPWEAPEDSA